MVVLSLCERVGGDGKPAEMLPLFIYFLLLLLGCVVFIYRSSCFAAEISLCGRLSVPFEAEAAAVSYGRIVVRPGCVESTGFSSQGEEQSTDFFFKKKGSSSF
ncbi:hypothetical protein CDAR_411031 [Caerostris darwini]|uniref:ATP synthase F0 subunit 8 n=1 Tax=Caerostris darwini TaxID=1538125 RepID=A0AAV4SCH3_9ARAC|nr:hypothetical protein CDAR_411031 [Caerostris darwini]